MHRREVSAIVPISGRNFPTLFSGMQGTVWGIVVTPARGDGAAALLKWLQTSAGAFPQGVSKRKKEKKYKKYSSRFVDERPRLNPRFVLVHR